MPIKYRIFSERSLVYVLGTGQITLEDLSHHIEELAKDPLYRAPMKKLVNYRDASLAALSKEETTTFTNKKVQFKDIFRNEKCVIVTTSDLDFGISRVHGAHIQSSGIDINVFRKLEDAKSWLEIDLEENEMNFS